MKAVIERQALSAVAEGVICDNNESGEVKTFLSQTLCTGQR